MEKEIIEKNRLIAEFMGAKVNGPCVNYPQPHFKIKLWSDTELEYHTSWDWLMPVVEKIESLGYRVSIERWLVQILEESSTDIFGLINAMAEKETDTKINLTVKAVIDFIQWYNTHNKK